MKIVAVLGSPREQSASSAIVNEILNSAAKNGHVFVVYEPSKMNVKGCRACGECKKHGVDCVQNDDLAEYWKNLHEADVLIVSSPNYHANICGPMISFLNRHYCLRTADRTLRLKSGVKLIGVFSQGNTDIHGYDNAYNWFLSRFTAYGMELIDTIVHTENMPVTKDSEIMKRARELGQKL